LSSPPTEVEEGSTRPRITAQTSYLPCENDQAKPDRLSRLARSTLLSKILMADRLSGAVWIEARTVTSGCPRTYCALPKSRSTAIKGIFARTF